MSKIKVRLKKNGVVNVKLKPANGVKVKTDTTYLYDPDLIAGWVDLAEDWAVKTDGKVEEEGVGIDYSSKAYAIGGTGTQTNNAKYYAEQARLSATSASNSATTATTQAGIATTQAGIATTKAGQAATSEYNAQQYSISAGSSATSASTSATHSQTWAEGTDEQVSALGGTHSAKEWASIVGSSLDDYTKTEDLASVALSNSYTDLDDTPTIGSATLTIQKNGTTVQTFSANATSNVTANITVPTTTSQLTNNSGFITGISSSDVTTALGYTPYNSTNPNGYQANVLEGVQVNGTDLTISSKKVNVLVPTKTSDLTNDSGYTTNVGTVTSVNNTNPDGSGNVSISVGDTLPSQTGNSGKFLTTNGTTTSWGTVDALPSQTGQSGKYLTTNGTSASWASVSVPTVNDATLTIQKNGTNVATFTANSSSNATANITVPTDTGDLTNGAGFITSSALSGYATEQWVTNQGYTKVTIRRL